MEDRLALMGSAGRIGARRIARARKAIARWKKQRPFSQDDAFARRLDQLGLDELRLVRVLELATTRPLRDYVRGHRLWATYTRLGTRDGTAPRADWDGHRALLHLVQPLLDDAWRGFEGDLAQLPADAAATLDLAAVGACAVEDLAAYVLGIIERTCLLELNVARLRGMLGGSDSRARYRSFIRMLSGRTYARAFFRDYPVLLELLATRIAMWHANARDIVMRWLADRDRVIDHIFGGREPGRLVGWSGGMGDSHRGGRTVATLRFEDGRKLIYKPRSLQVDVGFETVVIWCNERLPEHALRTARVCDRASYGWCEFIEQHELAASTDAGHFFYRQGKFLALFYALHASDLHCENVIASGEHPVYIDLETLFHAVPNATPAHARADDEYLWPITVSDTLIVPQERALVAGQGSFDFSVFGFRPERPSPVLAWVVQNAGTDEAGLAAAEWPLATHSHLPRWAGAHIGLDPHIEQVRSGFVAMYRLLAAHRGELPALLQQCFRDAPLRQVMRPTMLYAEFVRRSLHPDYLRDAVERRALFERMFNEAKGLAWINYLLAAEIRDLEQLDVPYFWRRFEDTCLYDASDAVVANIEFASPCDTVCAHVAGLNEADMQAQLGLIEFTLCGAAPDLERPLRRRPASRLADPDAAGVVRIDRADALREALDIADLLAAQTIQRGSAKYWMCQAVTVDGKATLRSPTMASLYFGQLGIALFVGMAGAISHNRAHVSLALDVLRTVRGWTEAGMANVAGLGVFTGILGYPYVMANLARALDNSVLLHEVFEWFETFDPQRYTDEVDVLGGSAGGVLLLQRLLSLAQRHAVRSPRLRELMEGFAERIVATHVAQQRGVGWLQTHKPGGKALTGFAHGNAGIAAALYVAGNTFDRATYRDLAGEALSYENSHFLKEAGNWQDLRDDDRQQIHDPTNREPMCAWCHGAAGIMLGRAWSLSVADPLDRMAGQLRHDLFAAERSLSSSRQTNDSLCHGYWGGLDVRSAAADLLPGEAALQRVVLLDPDAAERARHGAFLCGDAGRTRFGARFVPPDLMTGMAGVGYGLLRYAAPTRVPSVLGLDVLP